MYEYSDYTLPPDELGDGLTTYVVESLMLWTHYSPVLRQELGKAGAFQYLAAILRAANTCKPPDQVCNFF